MDRLHRHRRHARIHPPTLDRPTPTTPPQHTKTALGRALVDDLEQYGGVAHVRFAWSGQWAPACEITMGELATGTLDELGVAVDVPAIEPDRVWTVAYPDRLLIDRDRLRRLARPGCRVRVGEGT